MTKPTDDKFNSLSFLTKLTKSLLYSREKVKICAVFVTFVVFDRLSVANFPSVQSDDKFLSNPGFCVPDQFVNTYSKYIKKLTLDYFIDLCYKVRGEDRTVEIKKSLLDYDLKDDDETITDENKKWDISQGVSPEMLKKICKELNISMYAFDITKQCFLKTISNDLN